MKKEAELARQYLSREADWDEELETCGLVREHTLGVFYILEKLFAEEICHGNLIEVAPTGYHLQRQLLLSYYRWIRIVISTAIKMKQYCLFHCSRSTILID
jgi:hypothetical protein